VTRPALSSLLRRTVPPVVAAAVVGGIGTRPTSPWYRSLSKPSWDPPGAVFAPVWTTLYTLTAGASARAMRSMTPQQRRSYERALWLNMALNAGWCWIFFTAERPRPALVELLVLEASTLDLVRRAAAVDPAAAAALAPYAAWNAFAAALNTAIVVRNP
jgi:tryptophan-rich sensory protein